MVLAMVEVLGNGHSPARNRRALISVLLPGGDADRSGFVLGVEQTEFVEM
jgi:hypothetical protein